MNGAVLGMSRKEISSKIEEIIAFSGCERYIDTPVKRYSSGMTVRLGFAVAAHLDPEILVVDEVLAVGDADFQKKAIGKMQDLSTGEGRTVLFVSHNMDSIATLTNQVVVLENGLVKFMGATSNGIKEYLRGEKNTKNYYFQGMVDRPKITSVIVDTSLPGNVHEFGKELKFIFTVKLPIRVNNLALSFQILDESRIPVTHIWTIDSEKGIQREIGEYEFICNLPSPKLYMGHYTIQAHLSDSKTKIKFETLESVCQFKLQMMKNVRQDYKWQKGTCKYIEDNEWIIHKL